MTGVTGLIRGTAGRRERVVLVRADMDALPILEENDVEYRSKVDGVMHACGHDAHTAILLGLARVLMDRRDQFRARSSSSSSLRRSEVPGGAKAHDRGRRARKSARRCRVRPAHGAGPCRWARLSIARGPVLAASRCVQGRRSRARVATRRSRTRRSTRSWSAPT